MPMSLLKLYPKILEHFPPHDQKKKILERYQVLSYGFIHTNVFL